MSGAASVEAAAAGNLPTWAEAGPRRRAHMGRVAALMDRWAEDFGIDAADRIRWRAAAWIHDSLRDADPERLRRDVAPSLRDLPAALLHGPAAAARLAADDVADGPLLTAVAFHTLGHPELDLLGRALYLADYLEPGRGFEPAANAAARARLPAAFDAVLLQVAAHRIERLFRARRPLRPETAAFWNDLLSDR